MAKNNFQPRTKFEKWVRHFGGTKAVADALELEQTTVQHWLAGNSKPRSETAYKILGLAGKRLSLNDIINTFPEIEKA
jgi:hypothetical protein